MTEAAVEPVAFANYPIHSAPEVRTWDDEVDTELVCSSVTRVSDEVSTFAFVALTGSVFRFDPGQYCTITVEVDGELLSRCYTISSPPTRPYVLTISVKREPGGVVSNWLHSQLQVGDKIRVQGPFGVFSLGSHPSYKYLFLAAGVGVTPAMSMMRTLHDLGGPVDAVLIHSARSPRHTLFSSELAHVSAASPRLRHHVVVEEVTDEARAGDFVGRLTGEIVLAAAADLQEREIYVCGPQPYMDAVSELLVGLGVAPTQIHTESFSFESLIEQAQDPAAGILDNAPNETGSDGMEAPPFSVRFTATGTTVSVEQGEFILDAAQRQGVRLTSSCSQGMCGTCKTQMVSGAVEMNHMGGIRPKEIASNKILLCCSTPLEDVVLDA